MGRKDLGFPPIEPAGLSLKEALKWIAVGVITGLLCYGATEGIKGFIDPSRASAKPSVISTGCDK
jgi:hypothetical protein